MRMLIIVWFKPETKSLPDNSEYFCVAFSDLAFKGAIIKVYEWLAIVQ